MRQLVSRFRRPAEAPAPAVPGPVSRLGARDAQELCRTIEGLGLGSLWITDAAGTLIYLTDRAKQPLLGEREVGRTAFFDLFCAPDAECADDASGTRRTLPFAFARRTRFENLVACGMSRGERIWWSISGEARQDAHGEFSGFHGLIVDVTAERRVAEEAVLLAMNDPLTGLHNRGHMAQLLDKGLNAFAMQKRHCAVMTIDLDRFKQVNDTMGLALGDALLKMVSERLVAAIGDKERICRLGADEFQVILPDQEDRGLLGELAARIISVLSEPYSIEGKRCLIGASIGIAVAPFDGDTSDQLARACDLAVHAAKQSGGGRFRFYATDLLRAAEQRKQLEEDLLDALPRGEFELHYQPVVEARTNTVKAVEALIRWNHPQRGRISPALFIPIAEETGLITRIGEWTLRKACEDAAAWSSPLRVAVNVSPLQFADENLPRAVLGALASSGLDPDRLELEITEGVFLAEGGSTDAMFKSLKGIGVRLALDDFGTGYSSLGYLKTAPFDKIKIDQSFVRGAIGNETRHKAIISAIVTLAEALGMETTAEGVESFDQLDMIRELKVSHVQGFIFSKPIPNAELIAGMGGESEAEDGCAVKDWALKPDGPARQRYERMALFRSAGLIHEDHYYPITLRNLSVTGALIEGLLDVPVGTRFVIDFGEGQFVLATVRRSRKHQQGVEFDHALVDDGNGGLCTRHRILPQHLIAAGIPRNPEEFLNRQTTHLANGKISMPQFSVLNKNGTISGSHREAA
jgi:diguanylate cyclase (GGDEF)-like protein